MLNYAETLATIAIVISLGSPAVALYAARRDRPHLRIEARLVEPSGGTPYIVVDFVNAGRRPLILRMLGGSTGEELWSGQYFKSATEGLRLGEGERHQEKIDKEDAEGFVQHDETFAFELLWVEDSLGVRYEIPDSRRLLAALRASAP